MSTKTLMLRNNLILFFSAFLISIISWVNFSDMHVMQQVICALISVGGVYIIVYGGMWELKGSNGIKLIQSESYGEVSYHIIIIYGWFNLPISSVYHRHEGDFFVTQNLDKAKRVYCGLLEKSREKKKVVRTEIDMSNHKCKHE
jgi:hypothetical protein